MFKTVYRSFFLTRVQLNTDGLNTGIQEGESLVAIVPYSTYGDTNLHDNNVTVIVGKRVQIVPDETPVVDPQELVNDGVANA